MPRLTPPDAVLEIATRLDRSGFETWFVGGAVRDAFYGRPNLDWDLATAATPDQVRALFGARRTIPVGLAFGTVGVLDRQNVMHEVTTFRRDVKTDGRHAEVEFGVSLDDDLARRDFTINAIAYSSKLDEIRDPFGGRADLRAGILRAVGDPEDRMREDRLRALRAIRFAARFGFEIDQPTRNAIESSAPHLGRLSAERVKQELDKTMEQVRAPSVALRFWRDLGAFSTLIPPLAQVSDEALEVPDWLAMPGLARRPGRRLLRFAGLLGHVSARDASEVLTALKGSKVEIQGVAGLVDRWHRFGKSWTPEHTQSAVAVRRLVSGVGRTHVAAFMRLANAMWSAGRAHGANVPAPAAIHGAYRQMLRTALADPIDLASLAVDGDDLRSAGLRAGPALGRVLGTLLDAVLEDPARNTRDWLLREAAVLDTRFRLDSER